MVKILGPRLAGVTKSGAAMWLTLQDFSPLMHGASGMPPNPGKAIGGLSLCFRRTLTS